MDAYYINELRTAEKHWWSTEWRCLWGSLRWW